MASISFSDTSGKTFEEIEEKIGDVRHLLYTPVDTWDWGGFELEEYYEIKLSEWKNSSNGIRTMYRYPLRDKKKNRQRKRHENIIVAIDSLEKLQRMAKLIPGKSGFKALRNNPFPKGVKPKKRSRLTLIHDDHYVIFKTKGGHDHKKRKRNPVKLVPLADNLSELPPLPKDAFKDDIDSFLVCKIPAGSKFLIRREENDEGEFELLIKLKGEDPIEFGEFLDNAKFK